MNLLNVSEIFYSLQGEGARAGTPTVFIRLQGCSAKHACAMSTPQRDGVVCDTEFESGRGMTVAEIMTWIQCNAPTCRWITWTGGEPLDQLSVDHVKFFHEQDFDQALETSGVKPLQREVNDYIDFICVSPKVAEHILAKTWAGTCVNELRYVRHAGQLGLPQPAIPSVEYWLSPHSDGGEINFANLKHCVQLIQTAPKDGPLWRLSIQQHKLWKVL